MVVMGDGGTSRGPAGAMRPLGPLDVPDGRNGRVVAVRAVSDTDSLIFSSKSGMVVRIRAADVRQVGRNTQGVKVVTLDAGDALASVAKIAGDETDGAVQAPAASPDAPPAAE